MDTGIVDGASSAVEYEALRNAFNAHIGRVGDSIEQLVVISDSRAALGRFYNETDIPDNVDLYWVKGHSKYFLNFAADYLALHTRKNKWYRREDISEDVREHINKLVNKHLRG